MNNIKKILQEKRPNLATSSLRTYSSLLYNFVKKVFVDTDINDKNIPTLLKKETEILKYLGKNEIPKTLLSALYVVTENPLYREMMMEKIERYNKEMLKQEKNEKQKENWADQDEIHKLLQKHKKQANSLWSKTNKTPKDYQTIQDYILLLLYSGKYIPVRRAKDYGIDFKIKNIDKNSQNFLEKSKMVFHEYKTKNTYGKQTLNIPKALLRLLKKWIDINPTDYLLFDSLFQPLNSVKINQRLNKIFGKKVSVNALRHSYLSNKYQNTIQTQRDLAQDMNDMGSSLSMSKVYIKE